MGAAARVRVLTALANELATSIEDGEEMREVGAASAWLAGALGGFSGGARSRDWGCSRSGGCGGCVGGR